MLIEEIQARKAEIKTELESAEITEERISELETEVSTLEAEERTIVEKAAEIEAEERKVIESVEPEIEVPEIKEERKIMSYEVNSVEYRNAFLKTLMGKSLDEEEARAYAASDANNAVPTLTSNVFFEKMKKLAPMLSEITLMRAAGNLKFIVEGTRNDAAKHTENQGVSAAADTIVTVTLGSYEFMKVIGISKNASNMSVDGFEAWLADLLAGDIARQIDNYIINDSTNGIAAITYTTSTNQIVNTAGLTYDNLVDLVGLLPAAYDAEAKFLMSKKALMSVKKIKDDQKMPVFDFTEKTLFGYPVVIDDYITTANGAIYFGKWTDVVGNLSQDVLVEADASSGFLSGTINYRGYAAFDSKPAKTDAIVRFVTTTA